MKIQFMAFAGLVAMAVCLGPGCSREKGGENGVVQLKGCGASFPAPLYHKWFKDYSALHPSVRIDYGSCGSGHGVKEFINKTIDFSASDAAMTAEEIARVDVGVQPIPATAGGIVLAYNLKGINELRLSREAYAGIFLGKVTKWNDPLITAANPGLALPDNPINVLVRADSGGTTFVFTKHLAAISGEFAKNIGIGMSPKWPVGRGLKGNEGVTAGITLTPGSISYIEYGYARQQALFMASLENKAGNFVVPSFQSVQAGLAALDLPPNLVAWLSDPDGETSYPIVTYTWMLCYKRYSDPKKLDAMRDVIRYCLTVGQGDCEALGYVPLPNAVLGRSLAALDAIGR